MALVTPTSPGAGEVVNVARSPIKPKRRPAADSSGIDQERLVVCVGLKGIVGVARLVLPLRNLAGRIGATPWSALSRFASFLK